SCSPSASTGATETSLLVFLRQRSTKRGEKRPSRWRPAVLSSTGRGQRPARHCPYNKQGAMHPPDIPPAQPPLSSGPWWRELTSYHWFVLIVAALGWLFDTMDQQLFNLARVPAMKELLDPSQNIVLYGGYATAIFLIGWAIGGVAFGILGDRIGRART